MKSWKHLDPVWKPLKSFFFFSLISDFTNQCIYWIWMEDEVRIKLMLLNLSVMLRSSGFRDVQLWMLMSCTFQYLTDFSNWFTTIIRINQGPMSVSSALKTLLCHALFLGHQGVKKQSKQCVWLWVCNTSLLLDFISFRSLITKWEYICKIK